jgi:hypothetical protein
MAATTTSIEQSLNPPPGRYLVFTGLDLGTKSLYIDVGQSNAMLVHRCARYTLQSTGKVMFETVISAEKTVEELGWLTEPITFGTICCKPVQAGTSFDTWITALKAYLHQNHAHLWTRNTGNSV